MPLLFLISTFFSSIQMQIASVLPNSYISTGSRTHFISGQIFRVTTLLTLTRWNSSIHWERGFQQTKPHSVCALLFSLPPPLQEPSGCMSVRIKEAPRPRSSECCQQVNSPSLIALYPPPTPFPPREKRTQNLIVSDICGQFLIRVMKMSQRGKEWQEKSF